ncbi:MAG: hypothetical protein V4658_14425, partial [Bacteroidota bacterium]
MKKLKLHPMNQTLFLFLFVALGRLAVAQDADVTNRLNQQPSVSALLASAPGAFKATTDQPSFNVTGFETCELVLKNQYKSLLGTHYFYQQVYRDIPVYGSYVKVNTNTNGDVVSSFHTLVNINDYEVPPLTSTPVDYWVVGQGKLIPSLSESKDHHFTL